MVRRLGASRPLGRQRIMTAEGLPVPSELSTPRLLLKAYRPQDEEEFVALNGDPLARAHMDGPLTPAIARQRFMQCQQLDDVWAVRSRADDDYLGHAFITHGELLAEPEMGLILRPEVWGRGLGSEVARELVRYALDRYGQIVATVDIDHRASIGMLHNAGMRLRAEQHDDEGAYYVYAAQRRPAG